MGGLNSGVKDYNLSISIQAWWHVSWMFLFLFSPSSWGASLKKNLHIWNAYPKRLTCVLVHPTEWWGSDPKRCSKMIFNHFNLWICVHTERVIISNHRQHHAFWDFFECCTLSNLHYPLQNGVALSVGRGQVDGFSWLLRSPKLWVPKSWSLKNT